jgi:hypothetical protein
MKRILIGRHASRDIVCPSCRSVLDGAGISPGEPVTCPQCQTEFPAVVAGAVAASAAAVPASASPAPPSLSDLRPILDRIAANTERSAQTLREIRNWFAALIIFGLIITLLLNVHLVF